jgi:Domain of unknown function (DUF4926)
MIEEHDRVALKSDIESERLIAGDLGTVVHIYGDGEAYEVEFLTLNGKTVTVTTLEASRVRPIAPHEIAHARPLAEAEA